MGADTDRYSAPVPRHGGPRRAYEVASFGRRLAAYVLDAGVPYAVVLVLWVALGGYRDTASTLGSFYLLAIVAYLVWSWTTQGGTLAMAALGMRIEADDGRAVRFGPAAVRLVVLGLMQVLAFFVLVAAVLLFLYSFEPGRLSVPVVALILAFIVGGVAVLYLALRGPRYWHDRLSHTVVVRRDLRAAARPRDG